VGPRLDLQWKDSRAKLAGKYSLAAFDFENGTLVLTEAGAKRRAALYLACGHDALHDHDPGGIDVLSATLDGFAAVLRKENHTLKRALTDPRLLSGYWPTARCRGL
jgi:formamidopyrimidine-DNA glycosylase